MSYEGPFTELFTSIDDIRRIMASGQMGPQARMDLDTVMRLLRRWRIRYGDPQTYDPELDDQDRGAASDPKSLEAKLEALRKDVSSNVQELLSTRHTTDSLKAQAKRNSEMITYMHHDIIDLRGLLKELGTLLNQAGAASDKVAKNMINR